MLGPVVLAVVLIANVVALLIGQADFMPDGDPMYVVFLLVGSVLFVPAGVWSLFGWEHLRVEGDYLIHERTVFGYSISRTEYPLIDIARVRLDPRIDPQSSIPARLMRREKRRPIGDGTIHLHIDGRTIRVAEGLWGRPDVATDLARWIEARIPRAGGDDSARGDEVAESTEPSIVDRILGI